MITFSTNYSCICKVNKSIQIRKHRKRTASLLELQEFIFCVAGVRKNEWLLDCHQYSCGVLLHKSLRTDSEPVSCWSAALSGSVLRKMRVSTDNPKDLQCCNTHVPRGAFVPEDLTVTQVNSCYRFSANQFSSILGILYHNLYLHFIVSIHFYLVSHVSTCSQCLVFTDVK